MPRLPRTPRRRLLAGVGAVAAVAVAVGIILATGLTGSTKAAGQPTKAQGSTTVQRRDLVETDTESGTLSYANPQTVFNRLSGTVTWLPPIGRVIKPGGVLYRVDGAPVILFNGTLPAYRDLSEADTDGPDIEQLKRNLRSLGFDPDHQMTIDQTFDAATAAAVERWQESVGETQTGSITLGQIVFLPGAQRVTAVDAQLGSTGGSSNAASSAASATNTSGTVASHAEFVSLSTRPAKQTNPTNGGSSCKPSTSKPTGSESSAKQPTKCKQSAGGNSSAASSKQQLAALLALLKAETLELQKAKSGSGSGGGRSGGGSSTAAAGRGGGGGGGAAGGGTASAAAAGSASSGSGGAGANAQPILQTTSTQLVVTVDLDATMQSEAVVHEPVTVELPDGSTVDGKITQVSPVAQSSSSSSSSSSSGGSGAGGGGGGSSQPSATVPVTITLTGHHHVTGLDQAAVSVNFEQQKATNVLSVPVTALLATAGGGYAVQEAQQPGKLLPVTPGLFAAGFVQISGPGIFPGLQVTDSQG